MNSGTNGAGQDFHLSGCVVVSDPMPRSLSLLPIMPIPGTAPYPVRPGTEINDIPGTRWSGMFQNLGE
jgi:hypothetical protein